MPDDTYQEGDPKKGTTAVTPNAASGHRGYPCDEGALPSIKLPQRRWECVGLVAVVAGPFVIPVIGYLLSKGRDLTTPVYASEAIMFALGLSLTPIGYAQRNILRGGAGALCAVISIGFVLFAGNATVWCGSKQVEFTFIVTDVQTGKGIPNALISLSEGMDGMNAFRTDADGIAKFSYRCWADGKSSLVCDTGGAFFGDIKVRIGAEGFVELAGELETISGQRVWIFHGPPPARIHLQLAPKR